MTQDIAFKDLPIEAQKSASASAEFNKTQNIELQTTANLKRRN